MVRIQTSLQMDDEAKGLRYVAHHTLIVSFLLKSIAVKYSDLIMDQYML